MGVEKCVGIMAVWWRIDVVVAVVVDDVWHSCGDVGVSQSVVNWVPLGVLGELGEEGEGVVVSVGDVELQEGDVCGVGVDAEMYCIGEELMFGGVAGGVVGGGGVGGSSGAVWFTALLQVCFSSCSLCVACSIQVSKVLSANNHSSSSFNFWI